MALSSKNIYIIQFVVTAVSCVCCYTTYPTISGGTQAWQHNTSPKHQVVNVNDVNTVSRYGAMSIRMVVVIVTVVFMYEVNNVFGTFVVII